jgi:poly(beta-D-mannuronate) lyase
LTHYLTRMLSVAGFCAASAVLLAQPAAGASGSGDCFAVPRPVVSLNFGSRYEANSKTRSDIDESSNAKVDAALKPVDEFIQDLTRYANKVRQDPQKNQDLAVCVIKAIDTWAKADALSDMETDNAKLSVPSRIGGIAIAYSQVVSEATHYPNERRRIARWLRVRAYETMAFFDYRAPPKASRNNLRAWAGLAVGQIGVMQKNTKLIGWALETNRAMLADASTNGTLPLEMGRGKYALHYQIHALGPLTTSMALMCEAGYGNSGADMAKLAQIVKFTMKAVDNPSLVQPIAGKAQKFSKGIKANDHSLAWVEPYIAMTNDRSLSRAVDGYRPFSNSKLGGNITDLYENRSISCSTGGG